MLRSEPVGDLHERYCPAGHFWGTPEAPVAWVNVRARMLGDIAGATIETCPQHDGLPLNDGGRSSARAA